VIGRRRQRDWTDLANDSQTPYMVGRLLGANEMAVALLAQSGESDNARHIAEVLERMTAFFMIDVAPPSSSSAVTNVLPPPGLKR
jgi:hypothetical protein